MLIRGILEWLLAASVAVCAFAPPAAADPVIAAAGDIACDSSTPQSSTCHQNETSDLLLDPGLAAVLALGDLQYEAGALAGFNAYYAPTWGRVAQITRPTPGNHDYGTSGAAGYFDYFNSASAYYSYDIGLWHLVSLNSEIAHDAGSAQVAWLRADLAEHPSDCVLAYWHQPRFTSGPHHSDVSFEPFWQALYDYGADVALSAHDHTYERFAPQGPNGVADPARGIRQFVVGTGGRSHYAFGQVEPNSEVRDSSTFGVLELTLHDTSYEWTFVPEAGATFSDSGSSSCSLHQSTPPGGGGADPVPPPSPRLRTPLRSSPVPVRFGAGPGVFDALTWEGAGESASGARSSERARYAFRRVGRLLKSRARRFQHALRASVRSPHRYRAALRRAENRLRRALRHARHRLRARTLLGPGTALDRSLLARSITHYARAAARSKLGQRALVRDRVSAARSNFRRALVLVGRGNRR